MKNTSNYTGRVSNTSNFTQDEFKVFKSDVQSLKENLSVKLSNDILLLNSKWKLEKYCINKQEESIVVNENGYPVTWDIENPVLTSKVSVFYAPITNITNQKELTLFEVYLMIKSAKFLHHTNVLRTLHNKEENSAYKRRFFDYATFSGTFKTRNDKDLKVHSNLIAIDLDHLQENLEGIKEKVNSMKETVMSFISPNGDGLKVIFRIDHNKGSQEQYYKSISDHLYKHIGIPKQHIDGSCKNVSRACFLPSDPDAFLNPKSFYHG